MMNLYEVYGARRIHGQLVGRTLTISADNPEAAAAAYLGMYAGLEPEVFAVRRKAQDCLEVHGEPNN